MVEASQDRVEALGDLMQVFQGEFTFIQLAIGENTVDNLLQQALQPCGGGFEEGPGRRLHRIRQ